MKEKVKSDVPELWELEKELNREKYKYRYWQVLKSTIFTLVVVAAFAVLVTMLWLPVLRIYGSSMSPTLNDGDVVVSVKTGTWQPGDIIAFYYNNKILVKRVIAEAGDWVNITDNGDVYVNNQKLEEPYLFEKAYGDCNIVFPYQVPESRIFVMGDHRSVSVDSRNTAVGCVAEEQIVGKLIFCAWPFSECGWIDASVLN
ncbi:MAG: signal peptidase I [Brotaphodocola sp.]